MKNKLKFNPWSKKRIMLGVKSLTSRKDANYSADGVKWVSPPLPWWFIKKFLFRDEGAVSPVEIQKVINQIYRRHVCDDEYFFVHYFHGDEALNLYAEGKEEELKEFRENRSI